MIVESTRTLLFGIFVLAGRRLQAAQVIALAKPLGISATNVKSHLTRMVGQGVLKRAGRARRARYWPSPDRERVIEGISARLNEDLSEPWNGAWLALTFAKAGNRAERARFRAELWFDGFRPWAPGILIRPAWPERWALRRAERHLSRVQGLGMRGTLLGSIDKVAVQRLYGLDALDRDARRLTRRIHATRISTSAANAFTARLEVGGRVARLVGHDPRLPPELWAGRTGLGDLVRAFRGFESRVAPPAQRFLEDVLEADPA